MPLKVSLFPHGEWIFRVGIVVWVCNMDRREESFRLFQIVLEIYP